MILGSSKEFKNSQAERDNRNARTRFSEDTELAGDAHQGPPGPPGAAYLALALTLSLSVGLPRSRPIRVT